ncbi:MAG: heavy-metal-associated domain-containing protein [Acidimicrobiia bacterium]|nr:heavy-metal-associated domain-containing protein [Acidimicrobiia bacterium]
MSTFTSTYTVQGMTCGHCVNSVSEELKKIDGVSNVDIDLASGKVEISSENKIEQSLIEDAVSEAGYEVASD